MAAEAGVALAPLARHLPAAHGEVRARRSAPSRSARAANTR
jgi:hypothetical protein